MIDIKLRDFQRNFYQYVSQAEEFRVLNNSNAVVGYWTVNPLTASPVVKVAQSLDCDKCTQRTAEYKGESPDEHGEWMAMKVCEVCYKKFKPPKFSKI